MNWKSEPIEPRAYTPPGGGPRKSGPSFRIRGPLWAGLAALVVLLAGGSWLIGQLHVVEFELQPEQAKVDVARWSLSLGDQQLMSKGAHHAKVSAPGYITQEVTFEASEASARTIPVTLLPKPGELQVTVAPEVEAEVQLNGELAGTTGGVIADVEAGIYELKVWAEGFYPHEQSIDITGLGQRTELAVELKPIVRIVQAQLKVSSQPSGADILIDGRHRGRTPKQIEFAPDTVVKIALLHPGHEPARRSMTLRSGTQSYQATLTPRLGSVSIWPVPSTAQVRINGKSETRRQLKLPQMTQEITVEASGYVTQTYRVVPHPDQPKKIIARLRSQAQVTQSRRRQMEKKLGLEVATFRPYESFEIATSRRQIPVRLTRAFAIMKREVTNDLYWKYQSSHDSGTFQGHSLNEPTQPVVRLRWEQVARFANWLSEQAGVKPFYRMQGEKVVGFDASSVGYRLPSEAEWVWLVRSDHRYAWGNELRPPDRFGNLADRSVEGMLLSVLPDYNDGSVVSAAVGSYRVNAQGLYDLPGNVAEWIHDVFLEKLRLSTSAEAEAERVNPLGEATGRHHVVRGFSWRDGTARILSLTHRRYGNEARDDVGLRLAYYLEQQ